MRNLLSLLAAGVLFTAGPAYAVPADFTATLTLALSGFDPITFTGAGTGDTVPGGTATTPADSIVAGFVSRLTTALLGVLPGFSVCEQGLLAIPDPNAAVFPIPAGLGEAVPDCAPLGNGSLGEFTYDGAGAGIGSLLATAYLTNAQDKALVSIPLDKIGVGGTVNFLVLGTPASLTANPWTLDEVTVIGGLSSTAPAPFPACLAVDDPYDCCTEAGMGFCTQFTDSGFDHRDPGTGAGELKLVTTSLTNLGSLGTVPSIAVLDITFAPEPGSAVVGAGAVGALALLARRRARRS